MYFVSQGTGVEWGGEHDNTDPGQEPLRIQSHSPWGRREEQAQGSELGAAKIEVFCEFTAMRRGKAEWRSPSAVWVMVTEVSHGLMMAGQVHRDKAGLR